MDQNRLALLISTLYSSTDNAAIQEVSKQLNSWQQTPEAWSQADQLLTTPGLQAEFYYFFAQTIKTKIQYDMYQLQPTAFLSLRDSLLQKLLAVAHNSAAKPTRRQLCLAVADLTIQAVEVWESAIPDLANLLQMEHLAELLEILKLIPEETENLKLMTENGKRNLSRQRCLQHYNSVLELLNAKFPVDATPALQESALACFLAWLKFDSPPIQYAMAESPLVNFCLADLDKVSSTDLSVNDTAVEILTELVQTSSSHRNRHAHNPLVEMKVFPQISVMCQNLLLANLEDISFSDPDSLKLIARLLVVTGEAMMGNIASEYMRNSRVQELIVVIMKIFALQSLELADTCCPFLEDFLDATSGQGSAEVSNLHNTLFETIVVRMDVAKEPSFDGSDPFGSVDRDFFHFRSQSLVPLLYKVSRDFLTRPVGAERLVRGLIHNATTNGPATLQEAFSVAVKDQLPGITEIPDSLQTAVEFLIESLPQWIDVSSIHSCSLTDGFRRRGLIAIVGASPSYVNTEQQLFKTIDAVAQVLIRPVVVHRSLHVAAAIAFRELCFHSHTKKMIVANPNAIESITRLFTQTSGHLDAHEHSQVTEGITSVLSLCTDDALFNNLMTNMIMAPPIQGVEAARISGDSRHAGQAIDRLTAVIRSLSKLRPGSSRYNTIGDVVLRSLWPTVAGAMERFRSEADLIEKACRLIKHTLRCVPDLFKQLLLPLGQLLVRDFNSSQHSSYLYTAEVLVQEYGQDLEVRDVLTDLCARLAADGGRIVQQRMTAQPFGADSADELIEDLYGMLERFLRYSPTIVVKARLAVVAVIRLIVPVYARIRRRDTIEAVSAFTEEMFSGQWTHSVDIGTVTTEDVMAIRAALIEIAPALVQELVALLVSVCTRPMRQALPSLLMALNRFDESAFKNEWIVRGLQSVPANVMTDRDKQAAVIALSNPDDERTVNTCVEDILYRAELVGRRLRNEQAPTS